PPESTRTTPPELVVVVEPPVVPEPPLAVTADEPAEPEEPPLPEEPPVRVVPPVVPVDPPPAGPPAVVLAQAPATSINPANVPQESNHPGLRLPTEDSDSREEREGRVAEIKAMREE
ncbi:MAG TPA: hypothetical protein VJ801_14140, partial [Polyangia bacterium]|nr:hypothetical protein [Polyangia bacterium]